MTYFPSDVVDQRRPWRPSRLWFIPTVLFLAAGLVWLIHGFASVASTIDNLQRAPVPGTGVVSLTHGGGYTVYYEAPGAQHGSVPFFHVNVVPASPGAFVASLTRYGTSVTYGIGSHQGRAVLSLRLRHPGRFKVTTTLTSGQAPPGADIAFGGSIGSGIVTALLPSLPLIILGFGGTLTVLILRLARRRSVPRGFA